MASASLTMPEEVSLSSHISLLMEGHLQGLTGWLFLRLWERILITTRSISRDVEFHFTYTQYVC
ncbi:MAG: hypothetical protein K0R67_3520 [Paenibacillus sp.]|jgi:hypothetical protein|nr:hypothetical protein [Paenibacillus sp.]